VAVRAAERAAELAVEGEVLAAVAPAEAQVAEPEAGAAAELVEPEELAEPEARVAPGGPGELAVREAKAAEEQPEGRAEEPAGQEAATTTILMRIR
jgi:hypothetical protein